MSTAGWIAVALTSLVGIVAVVRLSRPRRQSGSDLGSVSEQWISEHRAGQRGDRR